MKHFSRRTSILLALCGGLWMSVSTPAAAQPSTSPSAKHAARLKYHPPANWLRHYLGDDRYKIDGKVWKVVSTQLDNYYHRPTCPNMLRQPNHLVIGFPSAAAAREGGYRPDPTCRPDTDNISYAARPSGNSGSANNGSTGRNVSTARAVTTINLGNQPQRITLADGASTALLPPNWKRTQSGASTIAGQSTLSDTLQPVNGRGSIRFSFVPLPPNLPINVAQILRPTTFAPALRQLNPDSQAFLDNLTVTSGRVGPLEGVTLTAKTGTIVPGLSGRAIIAGRGNKIYVVEDNSAGAASTKTILQSFQPR